MTPSNSVERKVIYQSMAMKMFLAHMAQRMHGIDLEGLLVVAIVALMLLLSICPRDKEPEEKR